MKTTVPVIIAFLSGFVMILAFFFNPEKSVVGRLEPEVLAWVTIVGGFTLLLGVVSIVRVNFGAVKRRGDGGVVKISLHAGRLCAGGFQIGLGFGYIELRAVAALAKLARRFIGDFLLFKARLGLGQTLGAVFWVYAHNHGTGLNAIALGRNHVQHPTQNLRAHVHGFIGLDAPHDGD